MKNKVEIETIKDKTIYFDKNSERFWVMDYSFSSIREARSFVKRELGTGFKGKYFIIDSFDGIKRFTAQRKIFNEYEGKYKVIGKIQDTVGNDRGEFEEKDLYPINEYNQKQEEKGKEMARQGWDLIEKSKRLKLSKE
jgi:hypothetical protein